MSENKSETKLDLASIKFEDARFDANKMNELGKQFKWLVHQVNSAKSPEKKRQAEKKLAVWTEKYGFYIEDYPDRFPPLQEGSND